MKGRPYKQSCSLTLLAQLLVFSQSKKKKKRKKTLPCVFSFFGQNARFKVECSNFHKSTESCQVQFFSLNNQVASWRANEKNKH